MLNTLLFCHPSLCKGGMSLAINADVCINGNVRKRDFRKISLYSGQLLLMILLGYD